MNVRRWPRYRDEVARSFRLHAWGSAGLNVALLAINLLTGGRWWSAWPLLATGLLLAVHYMISKALTVNEQWANERAQILRFKSYDHGHIESIHQRSEAGNQAAKRR